MNYPEPKNPKLAEFVGILLGDGCIGKYKCKKRDSFSTQYSVQITCNSIDDFEYIKHIESMIRELFDLIPKIRNRNNQNATDIRVFGKPLFNFLTENLELKKSPKWNNAQIPKNYTDKDLIKQVLKGYFDTDGSLVITKNNGQEYPRLEMKISPAPMQQQFIKALEDQEFRFGTYKIGKGKVRIQINGKQQLKKWCREIGFSNPKHIRKAIKFLETDKALNT